MYYGLRLKMFEQDITVEAIAKLLHTHRNTISNKLNGHGDFKGSELKQIKEAFFPDCTIDDLMRDRIA